MPQSTLLTKSARFAKEHIVLATRIVDSTAKIIISTALFYARKRQLLGDVGIGQGNMGHRPGPLLGDGLVMS